MSNETFDPCARQRGPVKRLLLSLAALSAALLGTNALAQTTSQTYYFSGSVIASTGPTYGLIAVGTPVSGSYTINFAAFPQTIGGVIGSSAGWNSTTFGGPIYGTAEPTSLIYTFTLSSPVPYSTAPIGSSVGSLADMGVASQMQATAGCGGTCGYTYVGYEVHYVTGTGTSGNGLTAVAATTSEVQLVRPTLNWDSTGLPLFTPDTTAQGYLITNSGNDVLDFTITTSAPAAPAITLVKSASISTYSAAGTSVTYRYQVANSGNTPLSGVNVSDPMVGLSSVSCPSGTLTSGASENCTATYTTTQADVDAGSISNTGTATGTPPTGPNVTATSSVKIPAVQTLSIALVKTASVANYAAPAATVTYSYKVTNNGNVDLNPVTVTDPMTGLSAVSCPGTSLAPGASESCTATYTTTQADVDAGSISNTGTATGTAPTGSNVVATSSLTIPASDTPSISVVKSANIASFSAAGTLVTYTYKVTNTGNVDFNLVSVTDPMGGLSAMTCSATALAPTASLVCTATYTTTAADVTMGSISNTATATGKPQVGASATATSTLTIPYVIPPNFTIADSATSVSVVQGNAASSTITTTVSGGFNSAISLAASGQPMGVVVSFNPTSIAAPGSGSSTMSISVGSAAAPGTYSITITGTGGAIVHSTTVTLTVVASIPTLQLSFTPANVAFGTVRRGGVAAKSVTVKNPGTGAVSIRNVTIPPHAGGDLLLPVNLCPATLAAGSSCTIYIGLFVTATGHVTATLAITDNAAGSPQMVPITVN